MPLAELRVIYSASGTIAAAAIVGDLDAIVEHKLYWAAIGEVSEGRYLTSILNSETTRRKVAPRQSRGQWGARDFDKLLAEAIPQFDKNNPLHAELSEAAERAETIAAAVELPEGIHFVRARKLIRDALRADGVAQKIDRLVGRVLGGQTS